MEIQITYEDSITGEQKQEIFSPPIGIGRVFNQIPAQFEGQEVQPLVLADTTNQISRFHALISLVDDRVIFEDKSANGTFINQQKIERTTITLASGDIINIGNYTITVTLLTQPEVGQDIQTVVAKSPETDQTIVSSPNPGAYVERSSTIIFNQDTDLLESVLVDNASESSTSDNSFPPKNIFSQQHVSISALRSTGIPIEEIEYAALGGGMGSFVWVDTIRNCGVKPEAIAVISLQTKPYRRYETLLRNCQIPRYKRIRSGSDSCPDNVWGWPGYALREAFRKFFTGQFLGTIEHLWQVFTEPVFADTYTPHADDVFKSMDREADRIGWDRMLRYGSIRQIRKTEDGRYCIAYAANTSEYQDRRFLIAKYVHLCTGYPALKLLPDLQRYREETGDLTSVVQGYEPNDHIFDQLERRGGTVIIRGSGIVASQIFDRIYKARKINSKIQVIHMNREPRRGYQFGRSKRYVENDWEFQPFNWPKGTWGGDMRQMLENADPLRRRELLQAWGGTTTASRAPWRASVKQGLKEKWYQIRYGVVDKVERSENGTLLTKMISNQGMMSVEADFIIDCTGLISDPKENPLLNDLITHYNLQLNPQGRFHVENNFEIPGMRNNRSRMYAAGVITLGGPYAPVDTFLGLQYAAHRSAENLAKIQAPGMKYLVGLYSLIQWFKWATNAKP